MKRLRAYLSSLILLALAGCMSAYTVRVDTKPEMSVAEVSERLASHYSVLGYHAAQEVFLSDYPLGAWISPQRGFIGHKEVDGALSIWIAPRSQSNDAASVVADLKDIVTSQLPSARVTVHEIRQLELR